MQNVIDATTYTIAHSHIQSTSTLVPVKPNKILSHTPATNKYIPLKLNQNCEEYLVTQKMAYIYKE